MRNRTLLYLAINLSVFLSVISSFSSDQTNWQELKGSHFITYFVKDEALAKEVLDKAEIYYKEIADRLGYARYWKFWLWEQRVKIYICPDKAAYLSSTHQPQWSGGFADYKNKRIVTYRWDEGFLDSFLPHEIAHLILRDFIGFNPEIPLWLDEGVAQWAEEAKRINSEQNMKKIVEDKKYIPLYEFTKMDIRTTKDTKLAELYYMQSISLVEFFIERYGSDGFIELCRRLRDGKTLAEALRSSSSFRLKDLDELERQWTEYVLKIVPSHKVPSYRIK